MALNSLEFNFEVNLNLLKDAQPGNVAIGVKCCQMGLDVTLQLGGEYTGHLTIRPTADGFEITPARAFDKGIGKPVKIKLTAPGSGSVEPDPNRQTI